MRVFIMWVKVSLTCKLCVCVLFMLYRVVSVMQVSLQYFWNQVSGLAFVFHMSAECGTLASALWVRFRRFMRSLLYLYHFFFCPESRWKLVLNFKMKFDVQIFATMFAWHHRRKLQNSLQSRYYADLEFFFKLYCSLWCSDLRTFVWLQIHTHN